jgi:glycosyltransferase involved in cell wall biosynthesis
MVERAAARNTAGPVLSVVLPNYNHARYLPRALDALLSQARPPDEIIVVDDCSTDTSRDVVARYAAKNSSIRLLPNDRNVGVIPTLSRGLGEACGRFVYFGAADDYVLPGFFAAAIAALQNHPQAGLFFGDASVMDGQSGRSLGVRPPVRPRFSAGFINASAVAKLLRRNDNYVPTGAAVFRRDAVISAGGFHNELATFADGYLVRKIALMRGFCYAPVAVMTWCVFSGGVSRTTSTRPERAKQLLTTIVSRLATDPTFPDWYADAFKRRWHFSTARLALEENPPDRDLLIDMGAQNSGDRAALNYFLNTFGGKAARILILGWLWWRFRPFSLVGLATTSMARRFDAPLRKPLQRQ